MLPTAVATGGTSNTTYVQITGANGWGTTPVSVTFQSAKEIEAKISDKSWDRQRQWEMKRDALVAALQALDRTDVAIMKLAAAYAEGRKNGAESEAQWKDLMWETRQIWTKEINGYDDTLGIVTLTCGRKADETLYKASSEIRLMGKRIFEGELDSNDAIIADIQKLRGDAVRNAREELGIEIK